MLEQAEDHAAHLRSEPHAFQRAALCTSQALGRAPSARLLPGAVSLILFLGSHTASDTAKTTP